MKKAIVVVDDPETARALADPMRRLILNVLADEVLTETQLARRFAVSEPLINHHVKVLKKISLVSVVKTEAESHGILQKFYEATAMCYVVDYEKLTPELKRYFFTIYIERLRGMLAALRYMGKFTGQFSSGMVEHLAETMAKAIVPVAKKLSDIPLKKSREEVIVELFSKVLASIKLLEPQISSLKLKGGV